MQPFKTSGLFPAEDTSKVIVGLDLGKMQDFSALVPLWPVGTRTPLDPYSPPQAIYEVNSIKRWPLGTNYNQIVDDVKRLFDHPKFAGGQLVIDATGGGIPVVDMFRLAKPNATITAIVITGGHAVTLKPNNVRHVSKGILINSSLAALVQERVRFAPDMPEANTIQRELRNYTVKQSALTAAQIYDAKDCEHDDIVLAFALAVFYGDRRGPLPRIVIVDMRKAALAEAEERKAMQAEFAAEQAARKPEPIRNDVMPNSHRAYELLGIPFTPEEIEQQRLLDETIAKMSQPLTTEAVIRDVFPDLLSDDPPSEYG